MLYLGLSTYGKIYMFKIWKYFALNSFNKGKNLSCFFPNHLSELKSSIASIFFWSRRGIAIIANNKSSIAYQHQQRSQWPIISCFIWMTLIKKDLDWDINAVFQWLLAQIFQMLHYTFWILYCKITIGRHWLPMATNDLQIDY